VLSLGQVQRVLQTMLDEGVPIRDLVRIFEGLSLQAKSSTDPDSLVEAARAALGPAIAARYAVDGTLTAITLDPRLEQSLLESLRPTENGLQLLLDTARAESLLADLTRIAEQGEERGASPVLVCSPQLRTALRRLVQMAVPRLPVLSYSEIAGCTLRIETIGVVNGAYPVAA
jgi:flagellar biosynthesis protein FlhA